MKTQNRYIYTFGRFTCTASLVMGGLISCTKPYGGLTEARKRQIEWEVAQEMRAEEAEMRARYNNPNTPAWERDGYRTNPELTRQWKRYVDENQIEVVEDEDASNTYQTAEHNNSDVAETTNQAESSDTATTANTAPQGSSFWENMKKIGLGIGILGGACYLSGWCGGSSDSSNQASAPSASSGGWFGSSSDTSDTNSIYAPRTNAEEKPKEEEDHELSPQEARDNIAHPEIYGSW